MSLPEEVVDTFGCALHWRSIPMRSRCMASAPEKSVKAGVTPKPDLELIRKRLKVAEEIAMEQRK